MADFRSTNQWKLSSRSKYDPFKRFSFKVVVEYNGPVYGIAHTSDEPSFLLIAGSTKLDYYSASDCKLSTNFSNHFKRSLCSCDIRNDNKLVAGSDVDGFVRCIDVEHRLSLRCFKIGAACHSVNFSVENEHISIASDNKTTQIYDIPSGEAINKFSEFTDSARCCIYCENGLLLVGSYDKQLRLFDTRSANVVNTFSHNDPVEAVKTFGGLLISGGGNSVKIWDPRMLVTPQVEFNDHHKTVTCLAASRNQGVLMSGGLDRHVNIYKAENGGFSWNHNLHYPSPILSLRSTYDDKVLAVGMSDGLLSFRGHTLKNQSAIPEKTPNVTNANNSIGIINNAYLKKHDRLLKKFNHGKALEVALSVNLRKQNNLNDLFALLRELIRRKALRKAMPNRPRLQARLLRCLRQNLNNCSYIVKEVILTFTEPGFPTLHSSVIIEARKLFEDSCAEMRLIKDMKSLQSQLELVNTIAHNYYSNVKSPVFKTLAE